MLLLLLLLLLLRGVQAHLHNRAASGVVGHSGDGRHLGRTIGVKLHIGSNLIQQRRWQLTKIL